MLVLFIVTSQSCLLLPLETISKKKLYDKVDKSNALSVLENDIQSDHHVTPTRAVGDAIVDVQEDNLITDMLDINTIGNWAKQKKPTVDAVKAFFPSIVWLKNYKVIENKTLEKIVLIYRRKSIFSLTYLLVSRLEQ